MNAKELAKAFYEAIKTPLRNLVLIAVSFILNLIIVSASEALKKYTNFDIPDDYKLQFMSYGTVITSILMMALDNFLHNVGKALTTTKSDPHPLTTGITRF